MEQQKFIIPIEKTPRYIAECKALNKFRKKYTFNWYNAISSSGSVGKARG